MALHKLTASTVKNAPPGKHSDGEGLWFVKRKDGGGQWVLRLQMHGRRREMGLGSYFDVSLAEARKEAAHWRSFVRNGGDAIKERERLKREAAKERPTLNVVFDECFEARKAQLKNDGKAGRWDSPMRVHILPKLGSIPIDEIDQRDVAATLKPIWQDKPDAARKAANRLGIVIEHGAAMGLNVDIQTVAKARALLGKQRREVQHTPSMPWKDVPPFYQSLGEGVAELALRFLILTGCRSGEVRGATMDEIDLSTGVWIIPAKRMKAGRLHRVPLSDEAISVIRLVEPHRRNELMFPGQRGDKPLSDMTWTQWFKRRGIQARPHGFRSSLRNWLAETTNAPREVAELCLAHETGGKVEIAYRRTDFLDQRRTLMARWADHCLGGTG